MSFLRKCVLVLLLGVTSPSFAQNCGGFADVSPANFFCNNVEWIFNRGVTLGCAASLYCPNDFVPRSQMAAFMNRLGTALTPTIVRATDATMSGTYDPVRIGCVSAPVVVGSFPRQATLLATLWNYNASAFKSIQLNAVYSTDGGMSWQNWPDFIMAHTIDLSEQRTLPLVAGPLNLDVGNTYLFAIRAITAHPAPTVQGECEMQVRVENRNPASPPF